MEIMGIEKLLHNTDFAGLKVYDYKVVTRLFKAHKTESKALTDAGR